MENTKHNVGAEVKAYREESAASFEGLIGTSKRSTISCLPRPSVVSAWLGGSVERIVDELMIMLHFLRQILLAPDA
ncbi:MAG: hypothetical protein M3Z05_20025 [Gemmatimonadota bacterium]|nr:hypothetical protein [Gemmatimonadota bacterium]